MAITITLIIIATVALAAFELWLFWTLGEREDARRRAEPRRREMRVIPVTEGSRVQPCVTTPLLSAGGGKSPLGSRRATFGIGSGSVAPRDDGNDREAERRHREDHHATPGR